MLAASRISFRPVALYPCRKISLIPVSSRACLVSCLLMLFIVDQSSSNVKQQLQGETRLHSDLGVNFRMNTVCCNDGKRLVYRLDIAPAVTHVYPIHSAQGFYHDFSEGG